MTPLILAKSPEQLVADMTSVVPGAYVACPSSSELVRELGGEPIDLETALAAPRRFSKIYAPSPRGDATCRSLAHRAAVAHGAALVVTELAAPSEAHTLLAASLQRKLGLLERLRVAAPPLAGVEAFTRARPEDLVRLFALTVPGALGDVDDLWSFAASPYERERYDASIDLMTRPSQVPRSILELGACEGLMTERLARAFPSAEIVACESHQPFVRRLEHRVAGLPNVRIEARSMDDVPLRADLVVAAEVLYYLNERMPATLQRLDARYLFTSCFPAFDALVQRELARFRCIAERDVAPRFEPASPDSPFFARRIGTHLAMYENRD